MALPYTDHYRIKASDCDITGHYRPDALFSAMQECAESHSELAGLGHDAFLSHGYFFVLARIHLVMHRFPAFGEAVSLSTWADTPNRFFCPRHHYLTDADGNCIGGASALWVILDTQARKVVNPTTLTLPYPPVDQAPDCPASMPTHLPSHVSSEYPPVSYQPQYSDYDLNRHVNNARYITWLCNAFPKAQLQSSFICDLTAGYEREIRDSGPVSITLDQKEEAFTFEVSSEQGRHFLAAGRLEERA